MADKEWEMRTALKKTERILDALGKGPVTLDYVKVTAENISEKFSPWEQEYEGIVTGDEIITIRHAADGQLLYTVNVTADGTMTAIAELWQMLAKKF